VVVEEYVPHSDFEVLVGHQWFHDGNLRFPHDPNFYDGAYRTVFGPAVCHNGRIYSASNENVALAIRRLTAKRCPERPGYHEKLFENQEKYIGNDFLPFLKRLQQKYFHFLEPLESCSDEATAHHADPHQKKALRLAAYRDLVDRGWLGDPAHLWMSSARWKMKREEWAKAGKKPRMIVDMKTPASLLGFRYMELLKQCQAAEPVSHNGGLIYFCKSPDPVTMRYVFKELEKPSTRFFYVLFSDDACFAVHTPSGVKRFNFDISSCDASHSASLFYALKALFPVWQQPEIQRLIDQCRSPLKIVSTQDKNMFVKLRPKRPMLYSGSTITTAINNLANFMIAHSVSTLTTFSPANITAAAEKVGYIVTGVDELSCIEDIQFLKHSPVYDEQGELHPLLNLGVLLRASGVCHGDLPGRGPLAIRARKFQASVLRGMYPYARFTLADKMKLAAGYDYIDLPGVTKADIAFKVGDFKDRSFVALDSSIYKRYKLADHEIDALHFEFATSGYMSFFRHTAIDKILGLDYGLVSNSLEPVVNNRGYFVDVN
jgi:hypothetical protein